MPTAAPVAQGTEQRTSIPPDAGSNPAGRAALREGPPLADALVSRHMRFRRSAVPAERSGVAGLHEPVELRFDARQTRLGLGAVRARRRRAVVLGGDRLRCDLAGSGDLAGSSALGR